MKGPVKDLDKAPDDHRHKERRLRRSLDVRTYALAKRVGKAINDFGMIRDGDRVLVAVSGGKDSVALLHLLAARLMWLPIRYELVAVHVLSDMRCAGCAHPDTLAKFFKDLKVEYHFEEMRVLGYLKERGLALNCYHCSQSRRKVLFDAAERYGCNRLAFGHHLDDITHTIMMNIFIHGRIDGMSPCQDFFKGSLTVIRPLAYVREAETAAHARRIGYPSHLCQCPFAEKNVRRTMREAVDVLKKACRWPDINAFRALYGKGAPGKAPQPRVGSQ